MWKEKKNMQQMTSEKQHDKSRYAAARKLNLLLLPTDKFQLLKMHPRSWLSFVVLWQEKDNYLSQRQEDWHAL